MSADDRQEHSIRYAGRPIITKAGAEVLGFHLYRYLSPWLRESGCRNLLVVPGFEASESQLGSYRISLTGAQPVENGWSLADLHDAWRYGNGRLCWEGGDGGLLTFEVLAILDEARDEQREKEHLLGFILIRCEEELGPVLLAQLSEYAREALAVARRNGVRLFFDEEKERPLKSLLYGLMDRLPEWVGCDHSSSLLLTHNLDAMTLERVEEDAFSVLVERVFFPAEEASEGEGPDRLVGMTVEADRLGETLLGHAFKYHKERPEQLFLSYRYEAGDEAGQSRWCFEGEDGEEVGGLRGWYEVESRPGEKRVVLVPLVYQEYGEQSLLGFLVLNFMAQEARVGVSTEAVLREINRSLSRHLRRSSLYTLSVRKMWVIRKVGESIEEIIQSGIRGEEALEEVIGQVSQFVAHQVQVPSFAIGYLKGEPGQRVLRYVHPQGWSHFDGLEMEVDVAQERRADSGVSALAIRLERPLVLTGGHGVGPDQAFRNFLWVDEAARTLHDSRQVGESEEQLRTFCTRLQDYYKPARDTAYATLAYPIRYCGHFLGIVTVEVEKDTDWLWWTGFGGHLFWEMVAREVATGFYILSDPGA